MDNTIFFELVGLIMLVVGAALTSLWMLVALTGAGILLAAMALEARKARTRTPTRSES